MTRFLGYLLQRYKENRYIVSQRSWIVLKHRCNRLHRWWFPYIWRLERKMLIKNIAFTFHAFLKVLVYKWFACALRVEGGSRRFTLLSQTFHTVSRSRDSCCWTWDSCRCTKTVSVCGKALTVLSWDRLSDTRDSLSHVWDSHTRTDI